MTRGITGKKLVRYGGLILFFLLIMGYGLARSRDLLFGIRLSVKGAANGETFSGSILPLSGTARHATAIYINSRVVPVSESGEWNDTIILLPGENVVTITASDKFGASVSKILVLYSTPPLPPTVPIDQNTPASAASSAHVQ